VASVIAFHEGTAPTASKVVESLSAVAAGAKELDIVLNRVTLLGPSPESQGLESFKYGATYAELKALRDAVPVSSGIHLKLILETSQLSREAIVAACVLAGAADWDYVKTSSGFCGGGATVEDVKLMKHSAEIISAVLPLEDGKRRRVMKVKASGGVRKFEDAIKMIDAGASRIGASSGVAIVEAAAAS
jgi:deoxyribose-phosphate aldolase